MKNLLPTIFAVVLLVSCQPSSQPISYGHDECTHCKMSIVEAPFAAELVTKKGKVFKFDAIECMLAYLKEQSDKDFAMYLVHDYAAPTEWLDATQCEYLVSNELPSPMGGYLSAYSMKQDADRMQAGKGGKTYDWASIVTLFEE